MAFPFGSFTHVTPERDRKRIRGGAAESTYGVLRKTIPAPEWLLFEARIADIERLAPRIEVPEELASRARRAVLRRLELTAPRTAGSAGA